MDMKENTGEDLTTDDVRTTVLAPELVVYDGWDGQHPLYHRERKIVGIVRVLGWITAALGAVVLVVALFSMLSNFTFGAMFLGSGLEVLLSGIFLLLISGISAAQYDMATALRVMREDVSRLSESHAKREEG